MYYPIGEVAKINGKDYDVLPAHGNNACHFCAFGNPITDEDAMICYGIACESDVREDQTDVRFKEITK